jgi:hypothetical protein
MRTALKFTALDFRAQRPMLRQTVLVIGIIAAMAVYLTFFGRDFIMYQYVPLATAFIGMYITQFLFYADEAGRLDILFATLGLKRDKVVIGRFVTLLVIGVSATLLGVLSVVISSLTTKTPLDIGILVQLAMFSIGLYLIMNGISTAVMFAMGYKRGRVLAMLAMVLPLAFFLTIANNGVGNVIEWFQAMPGWSLGIIVLVGGIVWYAGFAWIAANRYKARDLL